MRFLSSLAVFFALVMLLLAAGFTYLKQSDDGRHRVFSHVCRHLNAHATPEMKALRCNLLKEGHLHGKVLEIGPGREWYNS